MALAAYLGRDLLRDRRRAQVLYAAGVAAYVASFAGAELVSNFVSGANGGMVLLEETGEMIGATLLLWATYELARSHGFRLGPPASAPGRTARRA
jgi:hypothetical protein